jgi:inorganic pyrophosphatase
LLQVPFNKNGLEVLSAQKEILHNWYNLKMNATNYLGKIVEIKVDRYFGSRDPKHAFIYELNYGYVSDMQGLDAYYLGVRAPISTAKGRCLAVIHRTEDNEDKLVIIPEEKDDITNEEIEKLVHFQEKYFPHEIIRKQP